MRVLITGAAGMLGSALVPEFARRGHQVLATDLRLAGERLWPSLAPLEPLDVRSEAEIQRAFARFRPDLVAHLAAETILEFCELNPDAAYATNARGTESVAAACRRAGIPLVYVSTAGIFDGRQEEYTEADAPNPINVYGRAKLEGELSVRALLERHYIVRAGWMVGGGDRDHKFVAQIVRQVEAGARTVHAVDDKLGTPTYAPDFSRCLLDVLESGADFGTYHMACRGRASRYDVARHILQVLGRSDVEIVAVDSQFFAERYPVPRPRSEIMVNAHLERQGLNTMPAWEDAIAAYLDENLDAIRLGGAVTVAEAG